MLRVTQILMAVVFVVMRFDLSGSCGSLEECLVLNTGI